MLLRSNKVLFITTLAVLSTFAPAVNGQPTRGDAPATEQQPQRQLQLDGEGMNLAEWLASADDYSTLNGLMQLSGLDSHLVGGGPWTLLAPTNAAFEALPDLDLSKYSEPDWSAHLASLLLYHLAFPPGTLAELSEGMVVGTELGENLTVTSTDPITFNAVSVVVDPDNTATSGVAHGIDAVLLPSSATMTIPDILASNPEFEGLLGLVTAADLQGVFGEPGPFTVFAPTNSAIASLDEETVARLTSAEGLPELQRILKHHIVPGLYHSDTIEEGQVFTTLDGGMLTLSTQQVADDDEVSVFINGAEAVEGDILAANGIIHVVDGVLLPPPADTDTPVAEVAATADPEVVSGTTTIAPTEAPSSASASHVMSFLVMASTLPFFLLA